MEGDSPQYSQRDESSASNRSTQRRKQNKSQNSSRSRSRSSNSKQYSNKRKSSSESNNSLDEEKKRKKKVFDYDLFLDNSQIDALYQKTNDNFDFIKSRYGISKIYYEKQTQIPDMQGQLLKIIDDSNQKKYEAVLEILKLIAEGKNSKGDYIEVIILIPEGMVSLLIGKQGRQINKIMQESNSKVVANQPISSMQQRTISISGNTINVGKAINIIFEIMQDRSAIVYDIDKIPNKVPVDKLIVRARFIFSYNLKSFLNAQKSRNGRNLIQHVDYLMGTTTQFTSERHPQIMKDDVFCTIKGKLEPVQKTMIALFRKINEYYVQERSKPDYKIKMMIPAQYITKLIGKEGCMIRDLAARSGGAQIKIQSNKGDSRHIHEVPIEVAGTLQNKEEACALIVEKVEQFKNGGPILRTGKSLNDNLVEQYKNSIQENCISHDQKFKAQLKELEEDFGRQRSRSSGRPRKYSGGGGHHQYDQYPPRYSRSRSRSGRRDPYRERIETRGRYDERERERGERERYDNRDRQPDYEDKYRSSRVDRDRNIRDRRASRGTPQNSPGRSRKYTEETSSQKLKIPIIVTTKLVQVLSSSNYRLIKSITEQTGCRISIEKEKRLILNGTIETNTIAFKKIQQEFMRLGSD